MADMRDQVLFAAIGLDGILEHLDPSCALIPTASLRRLIGQAREGRL
jgi:hypothetical protein